MSAADIWPAPYLREQKIDASVEVPGSKSLSNRYLVLQYLSEQAAPLENLLAARDTALMQEALRTLKNARAWQEISIDTGLAGTVMRFVPPLAALREGVTHFDGDAGARSRPMGAILTALEQLGVQIERHNADFLPFSVRGTGKVIGGRVELDASSSSQFVSALLLAGAEFDQGLHLVHTGAKVPSLPHIEMTLEVLKVAGVKAFQVEERFEWVVRPGVVTLPGLVVEPDLSNAGPFMCAALANPSGGQVRILHFPEHTTQPGREFLSILPRLGAVVDTSELSLRSQVRVQSDGSVQGVDVNLAHAGEITPTVAALCAIAQGESQLRGVGHLRGHETDRLESIVAEVRKLGREAKILEDDTIYIGQMPRDGLRPVTFESYHDHRMATFGAIVGLRVPGCKVKDIETTAKTMPEFPALWAQMLSASGSTVGDKGGGRDLI